MYSNVHIGIHVGNNEEYENIVVVLPYGGYPGWILSHEDNR